MNKAVTPKQLELTAGKTRAELLPGARHRTLILRAPHSRKA